MAAKFKIPVSHFQGEVIVFRDQQEYDPVEKHPADSVALPVRHGYPRSDIGVAPLHSFRYGHHGPRYQVRYATWRGLTGIEEADATRLELIPVGRRVLLLVPSRRVQMVQLDTSTISHAVEVSETGVTDHALCGRSFPYNTRVLQGIPQCPDCIESEFRWVPFFVRPYVHPRDRKKVLSKAEKAKAEYARRPTVFDKLLDDTYLEPDAPEPVRAPFKIDPETLDETEDFIDPREGKVVTRAETGQRFKTEKAALKTEIKAARRSR